MSRESFNDCIEIAAKFGYENGLLVTAETFKEVLVRTLSKLARVVKQIEMPADEYIPLLFSDCLKEHYMCGAYIGGEKVVT